jgi:hypothetical protein
MTSMPGPCGTTGRGLGLGPGAGRHRGPGDRGLPEHPEAGRGDTPAGRQLPGGVQGDVRPGGLHLGGRLHPGGVVLAGRPVGADRPGDLLRRRRDRGRRGTQDGRPAIGHTGHPRTRGHPQAARPTGTVLVGLPLTAALWAGSMVQDMGIGLDRLLAATASAVLLSLCFGGVALAVGCATGRRALAAAAAAGLAIAGFLVNSLSSLAEGLRPSRPLTLFYQYAGNDPLRRGWISAMPPCCSASRRRWSWPRSSPSSDVTWRCEDRVDCQPSRGQPRSPPSELRTVWARRTS